MRRLTEIIVFCGSCCIQSKALFPTNNLLFFSKPVFICILTTEGVNSSPSELLRISVSIFFKPTAEFVVPKSIPTALDIYLSLNLIFRMQLN